MTEPVEGKEAAGQNPQMGPKSCLFFLLLLVLPVSCAVGISHLVRVGSDWLPDADEPIPVIFVAGIFVIAFAVLALLLLGLMLLERKEAKKLLDPGLEEFVPDGEAGLPPPEWREWAEKMGFVSVGLFLQAKTRWPVAAWRAPDRPTFFFGFIKGRWLTLEGEWSTFEVECSTLGGEWSTFEFVTRFENGVVLATGNKGILRPVSSEHGLYAQTYARNSPEELWTRHVEAEEYLVETGGAEFAQTEVAFPECFGEYRRRQMECLPRIPFSPLGRDITGGAKFYHLSVRKQHERGMIRLPSEIQEERVPLA